MLAAIITALPIPARAIPTGSSIATVRSTNPNTGYLGDTGAYGRDDRGAYISHAPRRIGGSSDGSGVDCNWADLNDGYMCSRDSWVMALGGPYPAPRVDYEFTVPESGNWYVWIRAQGGSSSAARRKTYWGLDGDPKGWSDDDLKHVSTPVTMALRRIGGIGRPYILKTSSRGVWLTAGETHTYTLNIWAGGAGFALDRIVITNDDSSNNLPNTVTSESREYMDNNRTDSACDPCDARFGGYPQDEDDNYYYDYFPKCGDPDLPGSSRDRYHGRSLR